MAFSRLLLFMLGGCDAYSYRPSRLPIIPNSPAQACGHGPQSRSDGRLRHISGSTIRAYQVGVSFLYTYLTSRLTSSAARSTASIDLVSAAAVSAAYLAKCNPPVFTPTHPIALERMTGTEVQHSTSTRAVTVVIAGGKIAPLPVRIYCRCCTCSSFFAGSRRTATHLRLRERRTNRLNSQSCRFTAIHACFLSALHAARCEQQRQPSKLLASS